MLPLVAGTAVLLMFAVLGTQPPKDGPVSAELREIVKADQAVRQSSAPITPEAAQKMVAEDGQRRERIVSLLNEGKLQTGEDFANASLVFQHGSVPADFLTAHELTILAVINGQRTTLAALAEDRFLEHLGKLQRFGTQFTLNKEGKMALGPLSEGHPTDVTDALRATMFLPTPGQWREHPGPEAYTAAKAEIEKRWKQGTDTTQIAQNSQRPEATELQKLATADNEAAIRRALEIYQADGLRTPDDFSNAAQALAHSKDSETLLLAHELAIVAAYWGKKDALPLVARTLDLFLIQSGGPTRYGIIASDKPAKSGALQDMPMAAEAVRVALGVSPARK